MEENEFSQWLFEGRPRQGKNMLPDGLNWLCYFKGSSKSHRENSISFTTAAAAIILYLVSLLPLQMKILSPNLNCKNLTSQIARWNSFIVINFNCGK